MLALVDAGSCPKGLAPALFLELLSRLTDLAAWQIWDLWTMLDIHSCGFVSEGCSASACVTRTQLCQAPAAVRAAAAPAAMASLAWL